MDFLVLNDDVKFIISKHLQSVLKIHTMLSKYHDLQKILFGEIVYDDDFFTILKLQDFKNAKMYKICANLNNTRDVIYIGSMCDTLSKCMSTFRIKSKSRIKWSHDKFYMMIRSSYINCKIELIENCPCNNAEELKNKK